MTNVLEVKIRENNSFQWKKNRFGWSERFFLLMAKKPERFQIAAGWRFTHGLGCFGFHGKINVALLSGRMSVLNYQDLCEKNCCHLLKICGSCWIFQLDNAFFQMANSNENGFLTIVSMSIHSKMYGTSWLICLWKWKTICHVVTMKRYYHLPLEKKSIKIY